MNPCPACAKAELCPTTGLVHAGCWSCEARALAKSPTFADSVMAGEKTPVYEAALEQIAGDRADEFHEEVKRWVKLIRSAR